MMEKRIKVKSKSGMEIEILGPTFKEGQPSDEERRDLWRSKITSREHMMRYLQTALRYWYSDGGYGSEKRKNPA